MLLSVMRHIVSLFLFFGMLAPIAGHSIQTASDIRIDVPPDGLVRIENRFGSVSTEVWTNPFVSVSASVEGNAQLRRSPILLDNRNSVLTISVVRTPLDQAVAVNLIVKIPETSRLEIGTTSGLISLSGLPAKATLKSESAIFSQNCQMELAQRSKQEHPGE